MAPEIVRSDPMIEDVLSAWSASLGDDATAYRGHVYRMFNFCRALLDDAAFDERVAVAAVYHDLGIWSDGTFDYLAPSAARAEAYLAEHGRADEVREVAEMIAWHHKLRPCRWTGGERAEAFRRADLVDVSLGVVRFGLPRTYVSEIRAAFPNAGFHRCLVRVGAAWLVRHPLRPLPMMRW